ncbi:MAG: hypothetical protein RIR68_1039 [Pseudomonadota bacterium]
MGGNVVHVQSLHGRAGFEVGAAGLQRGHVGVVGHLGVAGHHELQRIFLDGPIGHLVKGLQQLERLVGLGFGAVNLELLVPMGNFDLQTGLDGAQMSIHGAAKMRHAGIVVRREVVSDNQADNLPIPLMIGTYLMKKNGTP